MTNFRRRFLTVLLTIGLLAGTQTGAANADTRWDKRDNIVRVTNVSNEREKAAARVGITRNNDPTIDNKNYAIAYASCIDCRTVAVAVQVVVQTGPATSIVPDNEAVAVNDGCDTCETIAYARQFVVSADEGFKFSEDARDEITGISAAIYREARSGDPAFEMGAALDQLYEQLKAVVRADIDAGGKHSDGPTTERRALDSN